MPREFFDHTGDIGVRLSAETLPSLFREAARAFTDTLTDLSTVRATTPHPVKLASPTLDDLMVDWLSELLYRFEVQNLLPADGEVAIREVPDGWALDGIVRGEPFDPERHEIKVLIKGVTYHQLAVRNRDEGWDTVVVFDI
jgi:SHS2 domain-containing protein